MEGDLPDPREGHRRLRGGGQRHPRRRGEELLSPAPSQSGAPAGAPGRGADGDRLAGLAAVGGCALLWSLAGVFVKLVPWNPLAIAGSRSLIAALFLLLWVRKPRFTFSGAQIGAALANAATMLLFIWANKETTAANAILLQYGAPVYVALLGGPLLGEKPRIEHWLALGAIAFGMFLFFTGPEGTFLGGGNPVGDIVAIASGLSFALYILFMRAQKDGSPLESVILSHVLTAAIGLGASLFLPAPVLSTRALLAIAALGVVQIGLASLLLSWGIKRVSAVEGILVAVIEPALNPVWVFLFVGEIPGRGALLGGALIVAAVLVSSIVSIRRDAGLAREARAGGSAG